MFIDIKQLHRDQSVHYEYSENPKEGFELSLEGNYVKATRTTKFRSSPYYVNVEKIQAIIPVPQGTEMFSQVNLTSGEEIPSILTAEELLELIGD